MDQLRALKYFVKVAETGSFTRAAAAFSVPPSSLSRRISELEKRLGSTLLSRTTRVVKLTEIGQSYFEQVRQTLLQLEASDEAVRNYQTRPMGRLHISSMVGFGEFMLLPLIDEFRQRYPEVIPEISLSDTLSSLGRDDVDLAIRGGYAPDERVVAIRLMDNRFVPAAAPAYLERMGTPAHPSELKQHQGLIFRAPSGPNPWISELNGQWQDVTPQALVICNEGKWLLQKAVEGQGIVLMPRWALAPYLEQGLLRELAIEPAVDVTQNPEFGVYLLYQKQRYHVPKIKAAVDFLVARIKGRDRSGR